MLYQAQYRVHTIVTMVSGPLPGIVLKWMILKQNLRFEQLSETCLTLRFFLNYEMSESHFFGQFFLYLKIVLNIELNSAKYLITFLNDPFNSLFIKHGANNENKN